MKRSYYDIPRTSFLVHDIALECWTHLSSRTLLCTTSAIRVFELWLRTSGSSCNALDSQESDLLVETWEEIYTAHKKSVILVFELDLS